MSYTNKRDTKGRVKPLNQDTQILYREVLLTAAEINHVAATTNTIIPAPGAGKALKFEGAILNLYGGATDHDVDGDTCLRYTDNAGIIVSAVADDFYNDGTAGSIIYLVPQGAQEAEATVNELTEIALTANAAIVLHTDQDTSASAGDRKLRVGVWYRIINVLT